MIHLLLELISVQVVLVLALRPLVWWYFGIGRALRHLSSIDVSLRQLPAVNAYDQYFGRKPPKAA